MQLTKKRGIMLGVAACVALSAAGYYWHYVSNKDVIAKVGDLVITQAEFEREMKYRGGAFIQELDKTALLNEMIQQKLMLNKAYEQGYDERDDVKREYEYNLIGKVRKQFIDEKREQITVADEELKQYYTQHKADFFKPGQDRIAVLMMKKRGGLASQKQDERSKERLMEVVKLADQLPEAKDGFGKYSIDYSEHQVSRYKGGEVGWFRHNEESYWEAPVLKAGFALKQQGDISDVIETDKGFYLVRLMERKKGDHRAFEQVKASIYHTLIMAKQQSIKGEFQQQLQGEFAVNIDHEKLDTIDVSSQFAQQNSQPKVPSSGLIN